MDVSTFPATVQAESPPQPGQTALVPSKRGRPRHEATIKALATGAVSGMQTTEKESKTLKRQRLDSEANSFIS